jgi:NTE family protein
VLEENDIPSDLIAGTSIGAMVGGSYLAMQNINRVEDIALGTNWKKILSLMDPSLSQGFINGKKVEKFIEDCIGKTNIEDCKKPFSAVATDLKSGDAVVLNNGTLATAIRASISVPLVFKPVEIDGKLLVDGGLSLPVPVEVVRNMGAEFVIAINLDADYFTDEKQGQDFDFAKIAGNSINILRHHLASWNVKGADIVINPRVGNAHWGKFVNAESIIIAGKEAAKEVLPQLQEMIHPKNLVGL